MMLAFPMMGTYATVPAPSYALLVDRHLEILRVADGGILRVANLS